MPSSPAAAIQCTQSQRPHSLSSRGLLDVAKSRGRQHHIWLFRTKRRCAWISTVTRKKDTVASPCHVGEKGTNPVDSQVTNSLFLVYFLFMHDKGHAGFRVFKIDPVSVTLPLPPLFLSP